MELDESQSTKEYSVDDEPELLSIDHSPVHRCLMGSAVFALLSIILMAIGILVVCLTQPKSSHLCAWSFRRINPSSLIFSSEPRSVAIADVNHDNRLDIIVANPGTDTIGVFLSTDNNTFINQQSYSTGLGSKPYSVTIKDFNGDHHLDIAVANYAHHNVAIFFGNGDGTLRHPQLLSTSSSQPLFISAADFNRDNHTDLVVVNSGTNTIGIFLSLGNGSFHDQTTYFTGYDSLPYSLAIGDFNNDVHLDIAILNYGTSTIDILLGDGTGKFAASQTYSTGADSKPSSIALGDLNGDNHLDMVVSCYGSGTVAVFLSYGNGNFATPLSYSIGPKARPQLIQIGYFDDDRYLDVVVADADNDQLHIILGFGNGSLSTLTTKDLTQGARPMAVAVEHLDNDNRSDIALVNSGTNSLLVMMGYFVVPAVRPTTYFIGSNSRPSTMVVYDFNNDSHLDIAVGNYNDNNIVILNGIGNGSFAPGKVYATGDGSAPQHLSLADLNKDQQMDMIVVNVGSNSVGILLGQVNGTFAPQASYSTGNDSGPWFAAVGDIDNDQNLDIVTANSGSGNLGILLGYGNGSFADSETYETGISSTLDSVALVDVNYDANLDLIFPLDRTRVVCVALGYGNGTFGRMTCYSAGIKADTLMILVADFNGDNHPDIVYSNWFGGVISFFFGNGDGTFQERIDYSTGVGSQPYRMTITDYNHDNNADLGVANFGTNEILIFFGDGKGGFAVGRKYRISSDASPYDVAFADFDHDGHLEIIACYWSSGNVAVLTQYVAAEFTHKALYTTGSAPQSYSLAAADFNHDNLTDLVVANAGTDDVSILLGVGDGQFQLPIKHPIAIDAYPTYVITGDINNDHHFDVISVNSKGDSISVILGDGNGAFTSQGTYSTGYKSQPSGIGLGDFNQDGRVDCVVANRGTDGIGIMLGFDYALFHDQIITYSIENTLTPTDLLTADFNHDKYLDLAVIFEHSFLLTILLGYGNGSFWPFASFSTGNNSFPLGLAVHDLNNDTHLDLVVANSGLDHVGIFLGYGNGSFENMVLYSTGRGSRPTDVAVGDFNDDSLMDIVSTNNEGDAVAILLGTDSGDFASAITYSMGTLSKPYSIAIADFNNDGCLDIATANRGTSTAGVLLGYGNGSFAAPQTYIVGYQSWPWWITVADFNNDNVTDLALANYNNDEVSVLLGMGNGVFDAYKGYSIGSGSSPAGLFVSDFNGDRILDIAVADNLGYTTVVLFGFGDGTFLVGRKYSTGDGSGPLPIVVGDFNNDTHLDVAVGNTLSNNIKVLLGSGREPFAGVIPYSTGTRSQPRAVAVNDLNNDSLLDIIVANSGTDSVSILLGDGHGAFNTMMTYSLDTGSAPYSIAIGDFNNDTQSDMAVTNAGNDTVAILLGHGNGTFEMMAVYSTGSLSFPSTVTTGDLNNDDILDLVIANSGTNTILVLYGYGNGTFRNGTSHPLDYEYHPYSVVVANLTHDQWMDIVIACHGTDRIETLIKMC